MPGVFHPGLFFSSEMMMQYVSRHSFRGKSVLEVGAGSGIISLYIARMGGFVTATDISQLATENIRMNAAANSLFLTVIKTDLFNNLDRQYDWIVVNPPYYPRRPSTDAERAWYCGENHEYFSAFFSNLAAHLTPDGRAVMVLSDVCDLKTISRIALENNFLLKKEMEKEVWADGRNYIFRITPTV